VVFSNIEYTNGGSDDEEYANNEREGCVDEVNKEGGHET
jgi:hypothetical protein